MSKSLNIVFAGTPAFSLPSLDALFSSHHNLRAIYTQPDRPRGRGQKMQASSVKLWAEGHQLPIYQPLNFKNNSAIDELAALAPDVLVVIAYGLILPQPVLDIPRLGCINVHASLLPRWRGAAPIQYAILMGEKETGVTIMQMDAGMDTGAMLSHAKCTITDEDTTQTLHDKLANLAINPLINTLNALAENRAMPQAQVHSEATYAHKINKSQAQINWGQSAREINQLIRAFNPWPVAQTVFNEQIIRIHQARVVSDAVHAAAPGAILHIDKSGIKVNTGLGQLCIERLQFSGGKVITVSDLLNTAQKSLAVGAILS